MKVALVLMPDSRSCVPAAVRAQLASMDVCQPSPSRKGVPPLGLATLAAYLRENGVDTTAIDLRTDVTGMGSDQIRHLHEDTRWVCEAVTLELLVPILDRYFAGCALDELLRIDHGAEYYRAFARGRGMFLGGLMGSVEEIHELVATQWVHWSSFDVVGFGTYQSNMYATMLACIALRRQNPKQILIAGGPEVTQSINSARLLLYTGLVDAVVPGEALSATVALVQASSRNASLETVPGILTLDRHGNFLKTPDAPIQTVNEVPFPDFSDFPPEEYFPFTYPLATSRGCPFRCNFCSEKDMFGGRFRRMSVDVAHHNLRTATDTLRCQKVFFGDSLVNTSEKWIEALAQRILDDGLGISWEAYFRAATNRNMLSLLRRSGLVRAVIGLESVSDELLSVMVKRQTAASNLGAIDSFHDEGIPTSLSLIVGYPGESTREHGDLVALLEKLSERNVAIRQSARADYARNGFGPSPVQAYAEVCCFPLPFYLKPMSEIFDVPAEFALRVSAYGRMFESYRALPDRVSKLIASMPYTFESDQIPTQEVFRRLRRVESVPNVGGNLTSFGQRVHTMFHGLRGDDRISLAFPGAFEAGAGRAGLTYRSVGLEMDITCADVAPSTLQEVERGGTVRELEARCRAVTPSAQNQFRHMLAMAAVEGSVDVNLSKSRPEQAPARPSQRLPLVQLGVAKRSL